MGNRGKKKQNFGATKLGDNLPIYLFTKNAFLAGKIVALFFGAIGIIFIYLLGSELKNKFMGLIAAALLSFHHLFWFYGVRVLADAPLVSTVIVTIYCLVKLEKNKTLFWAISSGVMFLVMMLIKKQSIFFLVGFLVYLIIFKRKEAINNKSILVSWVIPLSALVVASFVFGSSFFNSFFSRFIILDGVHDPGLKVLNFFPWIFQWYILVPMILGLILIVIIYKKKEYYLFLTLFFIYYLGFELTVRTPEDRYIMPLFPIGLFIAIFAIMEIASYITLFLEKKFHFLKKILIVIFVIFLCWNFYSIGDPLIISKEKSYAGHQEAGEWLLENVPDDTPIFAGSPRMVRAFIGREYGGPGRFDEGGNLWYLRAEEYLNDKSAFERDITQLSKESDIYLEIDVWEYTQPSWYFPLTQDSINYFVGQGFNLVKVVDREVNTPQGKRNVSVIFILKKDKGSLNQNLNNMTVKKAT